MRLPSPSCLQISFILRCVDFSVGGNTQRLESVWLPRYVSATTQEGRKDAACFDGQTLTSAGGTGVFASILCCLKDDIYEDEGAQRRRPRSGQASGQAALVSGARSQREESESASASVAGATEAAELGEVGEPERLQPVMAATAAQA